MVFEFCIFEFLKRLRVRSKGCCFSKVIFSLRIFIYNFGSFLELIKLRIGKKLMVVLGSMWCFFCF